MAKKRVEWRGNKVVKTVDRVLEKRKNKAAEFVRGEVVTRFKGGFGKPSKRGERPHVQTGFLKASINWDKKGKARRVGAGIGGGASPNYAASLEVGRLQRPYLFPTLKIGRVKKRLLQILGKKLI